MNTIEQAYDISNTAISNLFRANGVMLPSESRTEFRWNEASQGHDVIALKWDGVSRNQTYGAPIYTELARLPLPKEWEWVWVGGTSVPLPPSPANAKMNNWALARFE